MLRHLHKFSVGFCDDQSHFVERMTNIILFVCTRARIHHSSARIVSHLLHFVSTESDVCYISISSSFLFSPRLSHSFGRMFIIIFISSQNAKYSSVIIGSHVKCSGGWPMLTQKYCAYNINVMSRHPHFLSLHDVALSIVVVVVDVGVGERYKCDAY